MTIFKKELRSGAVSFLAWSAVIGGLMAVCVGMYPSMAGSMGDVSDLFAGMGNFSAAFGLDKLQFGTILGFTVRSAAISWAWAGHSTPLSPPWDCWRERRAATRRSSCSPIR